MIKSAIVLFLFVSASAAGDQKNITAESGQNVTLTCRAANNNIRAVEWRRADLGDEYVLLYRDGHFDPARQHPSFKNRVDLQDRQMKDGDVSVILKDVTINDTGTYECRILTEETHSRSQSRKSISSIYLSVVDPPGQTGGDTEDGEKKDGLFVLKVCLPVVCVVVVAVFIVAVVVVFFIYKTCEQKENQDSYQPPAEQQLSCESPAAVPVLNTITEQRQTLGFV